MLLPEITEKVNAFLADEFEIDSSLLVPEASLRKDLGIDSLDVVDIVVLVEKDFGVKITVEDLKKLQTLGQMYSFIESRLN